jgi:hypothetical protein
MSDSTTDTSGQVFAPAAPEDFSNPLKQLWLAISPEHRKILEDNFERPKNEEDTSANFQAAVKLLASKGREDEFGRSGRQNLPLITDDATEAESREVLDGRRYSVEGIPEELCERQARGQGIPLIFFFDDIMLLLRNPSSPWAKLIKPPYTTFLSFDLDLQHIPTDLGKWMQACRRWIDFNYGPGERSGLSLEVRKAAILGWTEHHQIIVDGVLKAVGSIEVRAFFIYDQFVRAQACSHGKAGRKICLSKIDGEVLARARQRSHQLELDLLNSRPLLQIESSRPSSAQPTRPTPSTSRSAPYPSRSFRNEDAADKDVCCFKCGSKSHRATTCGAANSHVRYDQLKKSWINVSIIS